MSITHIGRLLRERISKEVFSLSTDIAGGASSDWGHYKQHIGIIQGLKLAVDLLDEIEKEL